jgi:hypothetical protein
MVDRTKKIFSILKIRMFFSGFGARDSIFKMAS